MGGRVSGRMWGECGVDMVDVVSQVWKGVWMGVCYDSDCDSNAVAIALLLLWWCYCCHYYDTYNTSVDATQAHLLTELIEPETQS